jgi:hypothetical protein
LNLIGRIGENPGLPFLTHLLAETAADNLPESSALDNFALETDPAARYYYEQ